MKCTLNGEFSPGEKKRYKPVILPLMQHSNAELLHSCNLYDWACTQNDRSHVMVICGKTTFPHLLVQPSGTSKGDQRSGGAGFASAELMAKIGGKGWIEREERQRTFIEHGYGAVTQACEGMMPVRVLKEVRVDEETRSG